MKHIPVMTLMIFAIIFSGCFKKSESTNRSQNSVQENNSEQINSHLAENIPEVENHTLVFENQPVFEEQPFVFENNPEVEAIIRDMINIDLKPYKAIDLVRVNFGVPDCENWLVTLQSRDADGTIAEVITLFLIKESKIAKYFLLGINDNFHRYTQYDIMGDIPGTRRGSGASAYGDYNGDGIYELFQYAFGGSGWFVVIKGYDAETEKIVNYCGGRGIPFGIIDPVKGPAPVEFMTYNGRYGFKVYIKAVTVAGGRDYVPEPMPYNGKWFFYAWDKAQKMYMEIGEVK
jgi:hypothetical protein